MPIRLAIAEDLDAVKDLFREYSTLVEAGICFESFKEELAGLPGRYNPLLIAEVDGKPAGCGALRPFNQFTAEMKRVYVRPEYQGVGLGREIADRLIADARRAGYRFVLLDTLPHLHRTIAMYRRRGFVEIPPYSNNPPEAICFELRL